MGLLEEARREATIAEAMKFLKANLSDLEARLRLIRELVAKQLYATALPHVDLVLKLAPNNQDVLRLVGIMLRFSRLVNRALEAVDTSLARESLAQTATVYFCFVLIGK
ncbi:hypothetical protein DFAR_2730037 [Desulfarculales bacterium]